MVQLTLVADDSRCTLEHALVVHTRRWRALLGDGKHVTSAAQATRRRFADWGERPLTRHEQSRVEAYFGAVVRGQTMRSREPDGAEARRCLVARALKEDLLEAGWSADRAAAEVLRVTGGAPCVGAAV